MMAITTSNSMSVKPRFRGSMRLISLVMADEQSTKTEKTEKNNRGRRAHHEQVPARGATQIASWSASHLASGPERRQKEETLATYLVVVVVSRTFQPSPCP